MTTIRVLDTETTGLLPEEGAALLEVASVTLQYTEDTGWIYGAPGTYADNFIAHVGDIPPGARAVHHIDPDMVHPSRVGVAGSNVITRENFIAGLSSSLEGGRIAAFHNAPFDLRFLPEIQGPIICTWRCALHLYPDAPGFGNQCLRYWLAVEPPAAMLAGLAPHRALYDAAVTAAILVKMLETHTPEELIRLSGEPVLLTTCRFGRHKGESWSEVPRSYLNWLLRDGKFDEDVIHTAKYHLGLL